ncbi:TPA: hypothetical protein DCL28_04385 [Candidatus Komeilibacteria bacterium]|nr:hypothetical protein [Candidatus Komeilibacteria bacterium]HBR13310.1 hypothetical protein [Candidatus Komeilibacteria bacterium]HBV02414.1 hypothetical protein [Candidatus Komeilibacteria bacterium]HCC73832.1 hypothetical protein [Candidatus Komeilibacteria bacterium]
MTCGIISPKSTKYRKRVFTNEETKQEIKELLRKIAAEYDMTIVSDRAFI